MAFCIELRCIGFVLAASRNVFCAADRTGAAVPLFFRRPARDFALAGASRHNNAKGMAPEKGSRFPEEIIHSRS